MRRIHSAGICPSIICYPSTECLTPEGLLPSKAPSERLCGLPGWRQDSHIITISFHGDSWSSLRDSHNPGARHPSPWTHVRVLGKAAFSRSNNSEATPQNPLFCTKANPWNNPASTHSPREICLMFAFTSTVRQAEESL